MIATAAATAIATLAIWMVVRDDPAERGYASYYPAGSHKSAAPSITAQLREVLSYRNTWLLFLIPGGLSGIILTFAGLWGVPYLQTQYGFAPREAAMMASAMLVLWSLSSLVYGPLSQRIGRRKPLYIGGFVIAMLCWSIVVFVPGLPRAALAALLAGVAVSAGVFVLTFAFAKESVPAHLGGSASGIANMGVMLGGLLMQPLVGFVLDRRWDGRLVDGVRVYDFSAYQAGFALILAWGALSLVLFAFTRETNCRQMP